MCAVITFRITHPGQAPVSQNVIRVTERSNIYHTQMSLSSAEIEVRLILFDHRSIRWPQMMPLRMIISWVQGSSTDL